MKQLIKETLTFRIDNEEEAMQTVETYKANQISEAYTLLKYKNDYKILIRTNQKIDEHK